MYLKHFQLNEYPFTISSDPKFLWLGEKYQEALASLEYCIIENKGFVLLIGDVGAGKTTLINVLTNSLGNDFFIIRLPDPALDEEAFFHFIASTFRLKEGFRNKAIFLRRFAKILERIRAADKKVLLIVDEAQRMTRELSEAIRLLSNLERHDGKLMNIILAGQNELGDFLWKDENRALRQRITIQYTILPLSTTETKAYLETRLRIAGTERRIFDAGAIREIHNFSKGYPRLVNIIADRAMLTAYTRGVFDIDKRIIKECAAELNIPKSAKKKTKQQQPAPAAPRTKLVPICAGIGFGLLLGLLVALIVIKVIPAFYDKKPLPAAVQDIEDTGRLESTTSEDITALPPPVIHREKYVFQFMDKTLRLTKPEHQKIQQICQFVKQYPGTTVKIFGYTDSLGDLGYNMQLSQTRADWVKQLMLDNGLNPDDIESSGMGPNNPLKPNDTLEGRRANRRVEIEIYSLEPILLQSDTAANPHTDK